VLALRHVGCGAAMGCVMLFGFADQAQAQALASGWNEHPNAKVRLIAGEGRMLGVELVMAPGWKTYWRMPGDAGVPPSFDWTGSSNVAAQTVLYPAPVSMADQGGIAVGYKSAVVFPVSVTLADETKPTRVMLEFGFGVCKDICIPVESKLVLDLPAGRADWPAAPSIKAHFQRVPQAVAAASKGAPTVLSLVSALAGDVPHIAVRSRGASEVYIEAPDGLFVPMAQKAPAPDGTVVFRFDLAKSPDVKELIGKSLLVTLVGADGAVETTVLAK
jgi:DsbC/DsbD-like thiol-disulfide interchange protein